MEEGGMYLLVDGNANLALGTSLTVDTPFLLQKNTLQKQLAYKDIVHHEETWAVEGLISGDAWVAQSVKRPTSAQVMISRFVGLSPASTQSLEPAQILCLTLSKTNI